MSRVGRFLRRAVPCVLLCVVCASAGGARELREAGFVQDLDPEELLTLMIEGDGPLIVDTRVPRHFEAGHIPGAWNVPTKNIWGWIPDFEEYEDRGIVFYCETGLSSDRASRKLRIEGFRKIFLIRGNFGRWKELGLPVEVTAPE